MSGPNISSIHSATAPDGAHLEYEVVGDGEPLVILHGIFAGRRTFSRQRELADRYRLILPSLRGHDGSGKELPPDYGIDTSDLRDLCAVLNVEAERFHLIGHSSGGAVAVAFARQYPERVRKIVLIEPTLLSLLPPGGRARIEREWGEVVEEGRRSGDRAALRAIMSWLGRHESAGNPQEVEARLEAMAPMAHLTVPHVEALLKFSVTPEELKQLPPGLLIYGGRPRELQLAMANELQQIRPDWPLVTIDDAGHNCFRDQPAMVNKAIRQFLAGGIPHV